MNLNQIDANTFYGLIKHHGQYTPGFGITTVSTPWTYYGTMTSAMLATEHLDGINKEPKYYVVQASCENEGDE